MTSSSSEWSSWVSDEDTSEPIAVTPGAPDGSPGKSRLSKVTQIIADSLLGGAPDSDDDYQDIEDYTIGTPWERLVSDVENVLQGWFAVGKESVESEVQLSLFGQGDALQFRLRVLPGASDMMSEMADPMLDFVPGMPLISRWYGVRRYMLCEITDPNGVFTDELEDSILSAYSVAVRNVIFK